MGNPQVRPHAPKGKFHLKKTKNMPFIQFNPPLGVWERT